MSEKKQKGGIETRFSTLHATAQSRRRVRLIEQDYWTKDGEPVQLFAYPLTVNDVIELDSKDCGTQAERNIEQIIYQCLDEHGEKYFTLLDKTDLLNTPAEVIGAIMIQLNGALSSFDQELKKNKE